MYYNLLYYNGIQEFPGTVFKTVIYMRKNNLQLG
jgi:hypothetical protein